MKNQRPLLIPGTSRGWGGRGAQREGGESAPALGCPRPGSSPGPPAPRRARGFVGPPSLGLLSSREARRGPPVCARGRQAWSTPLRPALASCGGEGGELKTKGRTRGGTLPQGSRGTALGAAGASGSARVSDSARVSGSARLPGRPRVLQAEGRTGGASGPRTPGWGASCGSRRRPAPGCPGTPAPRRGRPPRGQGGPRSADSGDFAPPPPEQQVQAGWRRRHPEGRQWMPFPSPLYTKLSERCVSRGGVSVCPQNQELTQPCGEYMLKKPFWF